MARAPIDEIGNRYGKLVVIAKAMVSQKRGWLCRCDCGRERTALGPALRQGQIKSCGCNGVRHGKARAIEYHTWNAMRFRCMNPNCLGYENYGGRGIKICARWLGPDGFKNFYADMGDRPGPGYSLDRINPNGDYEPNNCQWADAKTQKRNTRTSLERMTERVDAAITGVISSRTPSYSRAEVADLFRRLKLDLCGPTQRSA